jgi:hypothetical protein
VQSDLCICAFAGASLLRTKEKIQEFKNNNDTTWLFIGRTPCATRIRWQRAQSLGKQEYPAWDLHTNFYDRSTDRREAM